MALSTAADPERLVLWYALRMPTLSSHLLRCLGLGRGRGTGQRGYGKQPLNKARLGYGKGPGLQQRDNSGRNEQELRPSFLALVYI